MPQNIEQEEKNQELKKGELLRQAAVVVCLIVGTLLKKAELRGAAAIFWIAAAALAVNWILWVRKENKQKNPPSSNQE